MSAFTERLVPPRQERGEVREWVGVAVDGGDVDEAHAVIETDEA